MFRRGLHTAADSLCQGIRISVFPVVFFQCFNALFGLMEKLTDGLDLFRVFFHRAEYMKILYLRDADLDSRENEHKRQEQ